MNSTASARSLSPHELVTDWFELYHTAIYRHLMRLLGQPELAEDVLQETFLRALVALERTAAPDAPSAWLYRIATNLALNQLRRQQRWRWIPFFQADHGTRFESEFIQAQAVRSSLARMHVRDAELIVLHDYAGLSSTEIAALNGEKAVTVRVRLSRAYKRFRELYAQEYDHEL